MILNNIKKDIKTLYLEENIVQEELADEIGTSGQYLSEMVSNTTVSLSKMFVRMVEHLGFDIEIKFIKKAKRRGRYGNV